MKTSTRLLPALFILSAFTLPTIVLAETDDLAKEATTFDADASAQGGTQVTDSIADRFTAFAGSEDNSKSLVTGLRSGSAVTLTSTVNGQVTTTTFTPTTGQQGYGGAFISLALAQANLAAQGVTQPSAAQIQAALNGGSITVGTGTDAKTVQLSGVLALRASGEGWGEIAHQLNLNLGHVISDLHAAHERFTRTDVDQRPSKSDRDNTLEKAERVQPVERPERIERVERPERPERIDRPERPDLPSRR